MVFFSLFLIAQITNLANDINELIFSYQARQIYVLDAITDLSRMRIANLSRGYMLEGEEFAETVAGMQADYELKSLSFMENLHRFRDIALADTRFTEYERQARIVAVRGIENTFARYLEVGKNIFTAVEKKNKEEVYRAFLETIPIGNELDGKLEELRDLVFSTVKQKTWASTDRALSSKNTAYTATAAFVLLSLLALLFTVDSINRPLAALKTAIAEISNGNLNFPIRSERKDEFGMLSNTIGDMVAKISEHNKVTAIMDNLDSMIYISDLNYNLLYVNKHLSDAFGIDRKACIGQKCYKATRNKDSPCSFCKLPELLPQKDSLPSKTYEYIWEDVFNAWTGGTDSIMPWVDGSLVYFSSSRDVSQKKEQEEKLREAIHAAEMASMAKSSFLANMSHEIRTPMNAILGITEIQLQNEKHPAALKDAFSMIYSSGDLLLSIINDILDLSKIEAGKLELILAQYDTASLINDTVTLNIMRAGSKPITFELSIDENLPAALIGDELRIKQILNNVLSNAFKYTDKGLVKLSISVEANNPSLDSGIMIVFNISDTGRGMTDDQVSKLFDEYTRFNMEYNRKTEGTGLGMSITQNLINLMNGTISVKSEVNWGSVFTIRLPQKMVSSKVLGKKVAEGLQNFKTSGEKQLKRTRIVFEPMPHGRVLIVDDVESNLYVCKGLIAPYGIQTETAISGFEAIDKIKSGEVYDIIFMDHMMPQMDGIETVKNLRSLGYSHPIVALTANAVAGQSDVFLANGFDGFISKPIDVRELNTALKKFVRDKHLPETVAPVEPQILPEEEEPSMLSEFPELAEAFINDILKVSTVLESTHKKKGIYTDDEIQTFIISVHGLKNVLANIGESELRSVAEKLELAGRNKDTTAISSGIPDLLNKLPPVIEKLRNIKC
ncbi:MAG: ATP-binding protein [Treponema sp.]|nr:ATP-binding protein [Treponema sp.]